MDLTQRNRSSFQLAGTVSGRTDFDMVVRLAAVRRGGESEFSQCKVEGLSTEKMEVKASKQELKETEEMVQWRSIKQEEIDNVWKKLLGKHVQSGGDQARAYEGER